MTNKIHKYVSNFCSWYTSKFMAKEVVANIDTPYETLTSKLKTDGSMPHYFSALDFAYSKNEVRNIAVTGPYGAGKSTVIQSFLTLHQKIPHVNVSLAGFDISGKSESRNLDPREVELSILQQILYRVGRDVVPDSRIDRIQNRNTKHVRNLFFSILSLVLPVIMLFGLIYPYILTDYLSVSHSGAYLIINNGLIKVPLLALLFAFSVYQLTRIASRAGIFDKKIKLSKIAFLTGDTEVQGQESSSLLNNCLDEIVYFFSRSNYLTVVFEDLDRLGTSDIFIKLREINKIINNSKETGEPIRFIYAVRDDIFLGADVRTKFFDYIVPVIPVMDSKNSYSILKSKITDFSKEDLNCLRGASRYINDMRSLQNIINEYNLFMHVVGSNYNKAKLFTLIFYKNIFAIDYNLVDKKLGVLYSYMKDFCDRSLHLVQFGALEAELSILQRNLEHAMNELKNTNEEIREEIVCKFIPKMLWPNIQFITPTGYHQSNWNATAPSTLIDSEEQFFKFFSGDDEKYLGNQNQRHMATLSADVINSVFQEYKERVAFVRGDRYAEIEKIKSDIEALKQKIDRRNSIPLDELTRNIGIENFKQRALAYITNIKDPSVLTKDQECSIISSLKYGGYDAIYYFIVNGYLTHDYMMYRSIFHNGSITAEDNEFIKQVGNYIDHELSNKSFFIQNVEEVSREIVENSYLLRDGAYHHQIVVYLMNNDLHSFYSMINNLYSKDLGSIISVLRVLYENFSDTDTFNKLIFFSVSKAENQAKIINALNEFKPESMLNHLLISLLIYPNFSELSNKKVLKNLVQRYGWSLISELDSKQLHQFMCNAASIGVKYNDVRSVSSKVEETAIGYLINSRMYTFDRETFYNVALVGSQSYNDISMRYVSDAPWSFLNEHNLPNISKYTLENINLFVEYIFLHSKECLEAILFMFRNKDLWFELKERIVREMEFLMPDDFDIFQGEECLTEQQRLVLYNLFFNHDRVPHSWSSLRKYLAMDCDEDVLRNYLIRHAELLSLGGGDSDHYVTDDVYKKVLCDEAIEKEILKMVTLPLSLNYEIIDIDIPLDNLEILIRNGKIRLEPNVYKHIVNTFGLSDAIVELLLQLFSECQSEVVSNFDVYFSLDDDALFRKLFVGTLNNNEIAVGVRLFLLTKLSRNVSNSILYKINVHSGFMEEVAKSETSDVVKLVLATNYVRNGSPKRSELIALLGSLYNKDIQKILTNKSQVTIQTKLTDILLELLSSLKSKKFIYNFDIVADDRFVVKTLLGP